MKGTACRRLAGGLSAIGIKNLESDDKGLCGDGILDRGIGEKLIGAVVIRVGLVEGGFEWN